MRKTWTEIKNETMTKEEQRQAHRAAMRDLAEIELAISRLERRPNLLLESIANYIQALGGRLELHAVLPNRTVRLTHLLAATERKRPAPAVRRRHRQAEAIKR
jgi:hypothetical protein